ncbi:MAG: thioredoxin domain-containing protein [Asticcacaulis sp.]
MGKSLRVLTTGAVIGLAVLIAGCTKSGTTGAVSADDKVLGSDTAPITLIEYASVACPICAHVNEAVMPELKSKYIDTGKVRYVYRPMMTGVPTIASTGHRLAECAGKDRYFQTIDALMSAQKQMYVTGENDQNARPVLLNIAQSLGMSEDDFTKCVTDQAGLKRLNDLNTLYLERDKIKGTPTFFVNGKEMKMKKGDISDFDEAFKPILSSK